MAELTLTLPEESLVLPVLGPRDQHLRRIREALAVEIVHRNGELKVAGAEGPAAHARRTLEILLEVAARRGDVTPDDVGCALAEATGDAAFAPASPIDVLQIGRAVRPRTAGQMRYVEGIRQHDLVFAVGPAGTGKTYLAVALAVEWLKRKLIRKIVLVRPAVEAGESLGFLPGDLQAKINPYLRPLLDALHEMIDHEQIKRLMEQDVIEVIPLAYMRGRTLNEAFIILDEAQNTTIAQMKMFLTRMGQESKIVVSGDTTQVDLPARTASGLIDALGRLRRIEGVCMVTLTQADIVRHRLVQDIVRAYEETSGPGGSGRRR